MTTSSIPCSGSITAVTTSGAMGGVIGRGAAGQVERLSDSLRVGVFGEAPADQVDGVWWPRSRDLQCGAADLVDHFPSSYGRVSRLLFSRPDWDNSSQDGRGVRSIRAARGVVKVGSFPSDDTSLMVLTMSSGRRLKLLVIPSDTPELKARAQLSGLRDVSTACEADGAQKGTPAAGGSIVRCRWDDESATW